MINRRFGLSIHLWVLMLVATVGLAGCQRSTPVSQNPAILSSPAGGGGVTVDIAYLDHPPVVAVLDEVNTILTKYASRISVHRYDLDTPAGSAFAQARKLTEHTPLAIFINGTMEMNRDGRHVRFFSFPQGQGTGVVPEGSWTLEDLDAALGHAAGKP